MKIVPVIFAAALILIAFSAGSAVADTPESEVHALAYPSVTLNVTSSAFYNLTFMGLLVKTPNSMYVTNFNENRWSFTEINNTSYAYSSNVKLKNGIMMGDSMAPYDQNGGNSPPNEVSANVKISLNALGYALNNVSISNRSLAYGNFSFPDYSVMEITISIVFQQPIQGPGSVYLLQLIKSSNESKSAVNYYFGNLTQNMTDRMHGNHEGLYIPTAKSQISAFYWWNNTFELNKVAKNLTSLVALRDGGIYIEFHFPFNGTLKSIYQDPFLGIPGNPLFKNPIIKQDIGAVVNYLLVHAEFLGTGLAAGIGVLGISYSVYRKRRF